MAGVVCAGGTKLQHEGRVLFEAEKPASYGAAYLERAVRATVTLKETSGVLIFTGKRPRRVFVNDEVFPETQWRYEDALKSVKMMLPDGTSQVQMRFDEMASVKPVAVTFPIIGEGISGKALKGRCVNEQVTARYVWEGASGIFEVSLEGATPGALLDVPGSASYQRDGKQMYYLSKGATIQVAAPAPSGVVPALSVRLQRQGAMVAVAAVDRVALFARKDVLFAEAEAFKLTSGEAPSISKRHRNTRGGGCIFNWGGRGSCLEWTFEAPEDGAYELALVAACENAVAVRLLEVNGTQNALLELPGTGGWGHGPSTQWQAYVPQVAGKAMRFNFNKGVNTVRLTNPLGQHLNLDCLVAVPVR